MVDREQRLLLRIAARTNRVVARIRLREPPIYVWAGAKAAWLAFDGSGTVARVNPRTGAVGRPFRVGDGPSGFATSAGRVWLLAHRDGALVRVAGSRVTALTALPADDRTTPERLAALGGSLWATGRGLDLLQTNPETGAVRSTIEIGAAGIDVVAVGSHLAVVSATPAGARRGDPLVAAVAVVDPSRGAVVRTHTARAVSLTGVATLAGRVVVFDGLHGRLLSITP